MGQVRRDSITNTAITYVGIGLGYLNKGLLFPLLLSPAQVGLANVIMLMVSFFGQFSSLGTGMIVMRFLPFVRNQQEGKKALMTYALLMATGGVTLTSLALIVFHEPIVSVLGGRSPILSDYTFWVIPLGIMSTYFSILEHYLRSVGRTIISVFIQDFVLRLLVFSLLITFYFKMIEFDVFITVFFLLQLIPGFLLFTVVVIQDQMIISGSIKSLKVKFRQLMFQYGFFVYFNSLGRNVILMLDATMVTAMAGLEAAGVFTTMVFLSNALFVPYVSLIRISSPHVPRLWKNKELPELRALYTKVSLIGFFITFSLFSLAWFGIDFLLSFLPKDYSAGKYVFLFLMLGRMFDAIGGINGDILLTSKKYKMEVVLTIPLIVVTFGLNYYLIPIYGAVGAAIGTSFVYFTYNAVRLIVNYRYFNLHPFAIELLKVIALGMVMFTLTHFVLMTLDHQLLKALLGGICILLLFVVPVWKARLLPEEVTTFATLLKKKVNG
jgi:O-antigen/teichoic acid export membrane protein